MFTLKIKRTVHKRQSEGLLVEPESEEVFVQADRVIAHGWLDADRQKDVTESFGAEVDDYGDYAWGGDEDVRVFDARLIAVNFDGEDHWYLASKAWLMQDGRTVERLA